MRINPVRLLKIVGLVFLFAFLLFGVGALLGNVCLRFVDFR